MSDDVFHMGTLYHQPITALPVFLNLKVLESDSTKLKLEYISPKVNSRTVSKARVNQKFDGQLLNHSPIYVALGVERKETSLPSNYVPATNIFSLEAHFDSPLFDFKIENNDLKNFFHVVQMKDSVENITVENRGTYLEEFKVYSANELLNTKEVDLRFFSILNRFHHKYNRFGTREEFGKLLRDVKAVEKLLQMEVEVIYFDTAKFDVCYISSKYSCLMLLCYIVRSVSRKVCLTPSLLNSKRF
jgi:hypothetical protein